MSLDEAVRRADPITEAQLDRLALDTFEAELREAILARPVKRRPPRRRRPLVPAVALVAAALAALFVLLPGGGSGERAWAAELVRVAESAPRLLVGDWQVTRADQFAVGMGEMEFTDGARTVQLSWRRDAAPVQKDGILSWEQDGYVLELRGEAAAQAREQLRAVSVDEWLGAMPASVVQPADGDTVIDEMLLDLPLPPGFDRSRLDPQGAPRDRYQLGVRVVGAVACGWIEIWIGGGAKERAQAGQALTRVLRSSVLEALSHEGDYAGVLKVYAEAMASEGTVVAGKVTSVEASYKDALGC